MKIDVFAHFLPKEFIDAFSEQVANYGNFETMAQSMGWPAVWDLDLRLEIMDRYEDYVQILTPTGLAVETFCSPEDSPYLASIFNDAMAKVVNKYPQKFIGAVACLPLNNIDAAIKEIDRTINKLGFKGIILNTPIFIRNERNSGYDSKTTYENAIMKPLDYPDLFPIYERMSEYKLPIWIHPKGFNGVPVYNGEKKGKYGLAQMLGWPFESAIAMARIVASGILEKYPNLKFITHHCGGGIIPIMASRLNVGFHKHKILGEIYGQQDQQDLFKVKPAIDYFKMFYADTALDGDIDGLMCGYSFFGSDHMLFGTDFPYDLEGGDKYIRTIIEAVNKMHISDADKEKIFSGNIKRILRI